MPRSPYPWTALRALGAALRESLRGCSTRDAQLARERASIAARVEGLNGEVRNDSAHEDCLP